MSALFYRFLPMTFSSYVKLLVHVINMYTVTTILTKVQNHSACASKEMYVMFLHTHLQK